MLLILLVLLAALPAGAQTTLTRGTAFPTIQLDAGGAFGAGAGIKFSDGDTGIYESADDALVMKVGVSTYLFSSGGNADLPWVYSTSSSESYPGFSFNTDSNSGMYRIGADNIGFSVGGTKRLEIGGSQDVLIKDTTPTSGDTSFKIQAGANQGTYMTQWVGSSGDRMAVTVAGDGIVMANTAALFVRGYGGTWADSEHIVFDAITNFTDTDGVAQEFMVTKPNFAPSGGAVTFTDLTLETIINQTDGANGITRGLYINPTLTAATDFRALEVAAGKSVFGDIVQFENNATEPADCVSAIYGAVYFDTTDKKLCVCINDGTDDEWVPSDDYTHGGGHCSI
jgi:hypothetical protein